MAVKNYFKARIKGMNFPIRHKNAPHLPKPEHNPKVTTERGKRRNQRKGK